LDKAALRPLSYSGRPSYRRGELADDLYDRDARPTMYARTSLIEGDTLVFIRFPNDQIFYDDSGFPLSDRHLVHREKLLQTGSEKFIKVLTSPDIQFKLQRRLGCVNKLPPSVKYVMDLTPPEVSSRFPFRARQTVTCIHNLLCTSLLFSDYSALINIYLGRRRSPGTHLCALLLPGNSTVVHSREAMWCC
jgi:hypothetical protein